MTHFNAPLYPIKDDPEKNETLRKQMNADAAVKSYRSAGVPADKIVLGVPFYGRGWSGVKNARDGLFQKPGPTLPRGTWEAGVYDYKDLAANYFGKFTRHWHKEAQVPWLFDSKNGVMISYDDPESLKIKAEYVRKYDLGGVMIWELSADDSRRSLLNALYQVLRKK
jgi:chitinase